MQYYLRLLCYTGPDRQTSTQIHPDIILNELPRFGYGQPVNVGPDEDHPSTWPRYHVAYVTRMKQIPDPRVKGQKALLCEVFLAKESEWPQFVVPEELIRAVRGAEEL